MLKDKRIVVTGAASGMGRAIAIHFARAGARLALTDVNEAGLAETAGETSAFSTPCDLADETQIAPAMDRAVAALGGLDGLVNAAGILASAPFSETDAAVWQRMFAINLLAPAMMCRAAIPHLRAAGGGAIVNIASTGGQNPYPNLVAYGAAKAGLILASQTMAAELAPDIRVNVLCPGPIDTPMTQKLWGARPDGNRRNIEGVALGRVGTPDEIAEATLFLMSDMASFVNKSVLNVDGGRL